MLGPIRRPDGAFGGESWPDSQPAGRAAAGKGNDAMHYWVVGGVYSDTSFDEFAGDGREEAHGPFERYQDAVKEWRQRAWASVDNCHARYRIVSDRDE